MKKTGRMKSVLIVEDEPLHLEKVKTAFRGYEKEFNLESTNSLNSAREIIQKRRPDLILADNHLPDGEGREMINCTCGKCPVIIMTAYGDEKLAVRAMKEGALDYVVKLPESIAELPRTIERSLREWELLTEKERLTQELEKREKKYKKLVENALAGIGITDLSENLTFVNDTFAKITGYSREELTGKNLSDLTSKTTYKKLKCETKKRLTNQNSIYEATILNKDNKTVNIIVHGSPYKNSKGQITGTVGVIIDISKRKEAEQAIKKSEVFNREVINNAGEGIVVYNKELRYQLWNPFMEKITGKEANEVLGKYAPDIFPHLKEHGLEDSLKEALKGNQVNISDTPFRVPQTRKKGWISSLYSPHYDEKGNIIGVIATINDVTERKEAEEKLKESNKTKDRLFSILGHDLKNSISEVLGFSELLVNNYSNYNEKKTKEFLEYIHQATKDVSNLLLNLLEWSRLHRKKISYNPQRFNIKPLIEDSVKIYQSKAIKNNILIEIKISDTLMVFADQFMIHTVLRNLISNALKYTDQKGTITIHAEKVAEKVILGVSDTGKGISQEQQKKIFDPDQIYSTLGNSGEKGTGMGLILCKELIDKHEENLWVVSEAGKGSTFYFSLPIKDM